MWSHYAARHTGFIIMFDTEALVRDICKHRTEDLTIKLDKVTYLSELPEATPVFTETQLSFDTPEEICTTKQKEWEYEGEWRFYSHLPPTWLKFRGFQFNEECIKGIIFGTKIAEDDQKLILRAIESNPDYRVEFYLAKKDLQTGLIKAENKIIGRFRNGKFFDSGHTRNK